MPAYMHVSLQKQMGYKYVNNWVILLAFKQPILYLTNHCMFANYVCDQINFLPGCYNKLV